MSPVLVVFTYLDWPESAMAVLYLLAPHYKNFHLVFYYSWPDFLLINIASNKKILNSENLCNPDIILKFFKATCFLLDSASTIRNKGTVAAHPQRTNVKSKLVSYLCKTANNVNLEIKPPSSSSKQQQFFDGF